MRNQINESLSYLDMENHVTPILGIDQFDSRIGENEDIITLNFIVNSKAVADDLCEWLERGYDWIIDCEPSPGEVLDRKYYAFAEINRRTNAPKRIIEVLSDLDTLTGIKVDDWMCKIGNKQMPATVENITKNLILNPNDYKIEQEGELNEWREIAGLPTKPVYTSDDDIRQIQNQAGIFL